MRYIFFCVIIGIVTLLGTSVYLYQTSLHGNNQNSRSLVGEMYREIKSPTGFVNTQEEITLGAYVGRGIILIEFMRYGCLRCQQLFSTLVSLDQKYSEKGLRIIGIHTPQFSYEGEISNVTHAMAAAGITFPVVLDNTYATWMLYDGIIWPRTIMIGRDGRIIYDDSGEMDILEIERLIQEHLGNFESLSS